MLLPLAIGFVVGLLSGVFVSHWLALVLEILGVRGAAMPQRHPERRFRRLPLMLLHPITWLLVATIWIAIRVVDGTLSPAWGWGVLGYYLNFVFVGTIVTIAMRSQRKKQAQSNND